MVLVGSEAEILIIIEQVAGLQTFDGNSQRQQRIERGAGTFFCGPDEDVEASPSCSTRRNDSRQTIPCIEDIGFDQPLAHCYSKATLSRLPRYK